MVARSVRGELTDPDFSKLVLIFPLTELLRIMVQ
jgi:hypothetical protein